MPIPKLVPSLVLAAAMVLACPAWAADPMEDCFIQGLEGEEATACRDAASDAAYQVQLSWSLLETGKAEEALAAARRAVEAFPTYAEGRLALQQALVAAGAVDEAIADYRKAQAEGIGDERAFANNLAWYLYLRGHSEKALPIIEEWLASNPEPNDDPYDHAGPNYYPLALGTIAHVLAAVGRSEDAADHFIRAAELGGAEWQDRYRRWLTDMGFEPAEGEAGLAEALRACAATGEACKLYVE